MAESIWLITRRGKTTKPAADAYTHRPEQAKEFIFIALNNGRFTAQPSNRVLFSDKSFTTDGGLPPGGLRLKTETWHAE